VSSHLAKPKSVRMVPVTIEQDVSRLRSRCKKTPCHARMAQQCATFAIAGRIPRFTAQRGLGLLPAAAAAYFMLKTAARPQPGHFIDGNNYRMIERATASASRLKRFQSRVQFGVIGTPFAEHDPESKRWAARSIHPPSARPISST